MIIRIKTSENISDIFVAPEEVDYWIDTRKRALIVEIRGKRYEAARRIPKAALEYGLDQIHEAVRTDGFADLSVFPEE